MVYPSRLHANSLILHTSRALEDSVQGALPGGLRSGLSALGIDVVPVERSPARVDIDLVKREPTLALPDVATDPEETDNKEGEVSVEELVGGSNLLSRRRDRDVKLCKLASGLQCTT